MSSRNRQRSPRTKSKLYQIGIRCLAATAGTTRRHGLQLYQIGIRCLAATPTGRQCSLVPLYQIGIRCLAATCRLVVYYNKYYIRLELDV